MKAIPRSNVVDAFVLVRIVRVQGSHHHPVLGSEHPAPTPPPALPACLISSPRARPLLPRPLFVCFLLRPRAHDRALALALFLCKSSSAGVPRFHQPVLPVQATHFSDRVVVRASSLDPSSFAEIGTIQKDASFRRAELYSGTTQSCCLYRIYASTGAFKQNIGRWLHVKCNSFLVESKNCQKINLKFFQNQIFLSPFLSPGPPGIERSTVDGTEKNKLGPKLYDEIAEFLGNLQFL